MQEDVRPTVRVSVYLHFLPIDATNASSKSLRDCLLSRKSGSEFLLSISAVPSFRNRKNSVNESLSTQFEISGKGLKVNKVNPAHDANLLHEPVAKVIRRFPSPYFPAVESRCRLHRRPMLARLHVNLPARQTQH
jgi:hypothetical protein